MVDGVQLVRRHARIGVRICRSCHEYLEQLRAELPVRDEDITLIVIVGTLTALIDELEQDDARLAVELAGKRLDERPEIARPGIPYLLTRQRRSGLEPYEKISDLIRMSIRSDLKDRNRRLGELLRQFVRKIRIDLA